MKIILIAEGSYPYVLGGVAGWVQMLVTAMPEHEFELVAVSASRHKPRELKYKLPPNLKRIHDVYLLDRSDQPEGRPPRLGKSEERVCLDWFAFKEGAEAALPVMADAQKFGGAHAFLKQEAFWKLLAASYRSDTPDGSFLAYYRAWRSMFAPAVHLLRQPYPQGDVYHAVSTGYAGLIAACLRLKRGTPFILTEHGLYAREREEELRNAAWIDPPAFRDRWIAYFYHLAHGAYKTADRTVALYEGARRTQLGLGLPAQRSLVIPNGVPFERLSSLPRQVHADRDKIIFGAIVRIVPIKDIKTMLKAVRIAAAQIPGMQLWIMGPTEEDPEYADECLRLAAELQIADFVSFKGRVSIADYLPKMDALLLSSISESQPLALLEGMAAGIPSVCTDVGSCRELIEGTNADGLGSAGYLVPPQDPDALAGAMIRLYRNPEARVRMGLAGQRRVESHYRFDRTVDAYRRLYEEVTS